MQSLFLSLSSIKLLNIPLVLGSNNNLLSPLYLDLNLFIFSFLLKNIPPKKTKKKTKRLCSHFSTYNLQKKNG